MTSSPRWLSRYQQGEREQVWQELRQLGSTVRQSPWAPEAQLVCDEMAHRARHNIELIVARLAKDGYEFHSLGHEQNPPIPHVPPTAGAAANADWLEQQFGMVPMTLLSWLRIVGDVWLVGTHPAWPESAAADPLVIELEGTQYPADYPLRNQVEEQWTGWREQQANHPEIGAFVLPVAPDRFHKNNTSGGGAYGFVLPDGCADGLFSWEITMPFVSYLNWTFRQGGFLWPTDDANRWQVRRRLVQDLLPL